MEGQGSGCSYGGLLGGGWEPWPVVVLGSRWMTRSHLKTEHTAVSHLDRPLLKVVLTNFEIPYGGEGIHNFFCIFLRN